LETGASWDSAVTFICSKSFQELTDHRAGMGDLDLSRASAICGRLRLCAQNLHSCVLEINLRPLSHFMLSNPLICDPCHTSCSQTLSFATPVTLHALKPSHLRPLSHFRLSNPLICDPRHTSGSQSLSFATRVALQALWVDGVGPWGARKSEGFPIPDWLSQLRNKSVPGEVINPR
jgi:hypothetical protein